MMVDIPGDDGRGDEEVEEKIIHFSIFFQSRVVFHEEICKIQFLGLGVADPRAPEGESLATSNQQGEKEEGRRRGARAAEEKGEATEGGEGAGLRAGVAETADIAISYLG